MQLTLFVKEKQMQLHKSNYYYLKGDSANPFNYNPHPVDMTNLTLSREMQNMAERLADNAHDIWAKKKKEELITCG